MTGLILILTGLQMATDTVTLDVAAALERGLETAPVLEASRYRAEAARRRSNQASPWANPLIAVSVENLGQSEAFTGIPGAEGLEGQAVLTAPLPFGSERAGAIRTAQAEERIAAASADAASLMIRSELLGSIGAALRDQVLASSARAEAESLADIARSLSLQAETGRAADGDAARAHLAEGVARTRLARREGASALTAADLARRLGFEAGTALQVQAPACAVPVAGGVAPSAPGEAVAELPPDVRAARARVDAARGATEIARGIRMPDLAPQVGVRRSGGNTGLYVGLATTLPIFDRGAERVGASIAEESSALAEQRDVEERWAAARAGAHAVLSALERAGTHFDARWFESLERTVTAAEARYRLGEGTLIELLDSRRARLQALDDYHVWQAEWWTARVEVERLEGRPAPASVICSDPYLEGR